VIIVSLIDVSSSSHLSQVSTTFRQTSVDSPLRGLADREKAPLGKLVVTIAKVKPHLFVGKQPVTFDRL
jgi:hypothetical protein